MRNASYGRNRCLTAPKAPFYIEQKGGMTVEKRKFLGVHFTCCNVYSRVYINRDKTSYQGACPRCGKRVSLRIGSGGTDARFFKAG